MRDYLAIFRFDTPLDLLSPRNFEFPPGKVRLIPAHRFDQNDVLLECGIEAEVTVPADGIEEGFQRAGQLADLMLSILSFSQACVISPPTFDRIIDFSPGILDREMVQQICVPKSIKPRKRFQEEQFAPVWEHLNKVPVTDQVRITMAFHWYRKALMETIPSDQFSNLWAALEVLNPILKRKHELVPDKRSIRKCPECNADVITSPSSRGVEYALTDLINERNWRRVKDARDGLQHPPSNIEPVLKAVLDSLPVLKRAVPAALFDALGIPSDKASALVRQPLGFVNQPIVRYHTKIHNFPQERLLSRDTMPRFVLNVSEPSIVPVPGSERRREERTLNRSLLNVEGFACDDVNEVWVYETGPENPGEFVIQTGDSEYAATPLP